jgi:hypothetical protein
MGLKGAKEVGAAAREGGARPAVAHQRQECRRCCLGQGTEGAPLHQRDEQTDNPVRNRPPQHRGVRPSCRERRTQGTHAGKHAGVPVALVTQAACGQQDAGGGCKRRVAGVGRRVSASVGGARHSRHPRDIVRQPILAADSRGARLCRVPGRRRRRRRTWPHLIHEMFQRPAFAG